jgi:hypothetical protein
MGSVFSGPYAETPIGAVDSLLIAIQKYDSNATRKKICLENDQHSYSIIYSHHGTTYESMVYLTKSWNGKSYYASI